MYPTESLTSSWDETNWANEQADFAFAERMEHEMYYADDTEDDVPAEVAAEFEEE